MLNNKFPQNLWPQHNEENQPILSPKQQFQIQRGWGENGSQTLTQGSWVRLKSISVSVFSPSSHIPFPRNKFSVAPRKFSGNFPARYIRCTEGSLHVINNSICSTVSVFLFISQVGAIFNSFHKFKWNETLANVEDAGLSLVKERDKSKRVGENWTTSLFQG